MLQTRNEPKGSKLSSPQSEGLDGNRLAHVADLIRKDADAGLYDGAVITVSRRGNVVFNEAIGHTDKDKGRSAKHDDVFAVMSLSKSLSAALLLMRCEKGEVSLITPIAEIIPEYGSLGKDAITIGQVLTHTAGLPTLPPVPPEKMGDLEFCVQAMCKLPLQRSPGKSVSYSGWASHYLIGEVVRRLDGGSRPLRQILKEDLFQPLGMTDTSLGLRPDLQPRRVPLVRRSNKPGAYPPERLAMLEEVLGREDSELPSAGCFSTASDIHRFVRMIASGGQLDGVRILSPMTIRLATSNRTGDMPNEFWSGLYSENKWDVWPANLGYGFVVRGDQVHATNLGLLNSPETYGHAGAGSMLFWTNPHLDLSFVMLTAGWLDEKGSLLRFQKISDAVLSAVSDIDPQR